jgi:hypothetical protein
MKELHSLNLGKLSVLEFGQHLKTVNNGIAALGFPVDVDFKAYQTKSNLEIVEYDKAMLQVRKSDETEKIATADRLRDNALSATTRQLSVFELSENENEVLAYKSLNTLFKTYKGIQAWNFEEETNGIDNLIADLNNAKYLPSVTLLNMGELVTRIGNKNQAFKALFEGRTQETAGKDVFDTKQLRAQMTVTYNDMIAYILVMAKTKKTDEFTKSLDIVNSVRKYYADMLAKRKKLTPTSTPEAIPPMEL